MQRQRNYEQDLQEDRQCLALVPMCCSSGIQGPIRDAEMSQGGYICIEVRIGVVLQIVGAFGSRSSSIQ